MAPLLDLYRQLSTRSTSDGIDRSRRPTDPDGLVLEAWAEGFMVGSLIIMTCITIANMRKGVLLHKLILIELIFGYWQGFFILFQYPIYAWWLSIAAIPLNISWWLHNVIAWLKLKPFLNQTFSRIFIGTIILVIPYWIVEIYANFAFFHNVNNVFLATRPWEALCRDPWWIIAAVLLMYNIKTKYDLSLFQIVRISPRFGVMLAAMTLSIIFIVLDVLSVTDAFQQILPIGINPFWKLSFVFKCLTDSVILDDFKTALDRLRAFKISRLGSFAVDNNDQRSREHAQAVHNANNWAEPSNHDTSMSMTMNTNENAALAHHRNKRSESNTATHIEDHRPDIVRVASRDRDLEEAGVMIMDHADNSPSGSGSTPILQRSNWHDRTNQVDVEYAMAMREVALATKKHSTSSGDTL